MDTQFTFVSNTDSNQILDTFDPGLTETLRYEIDAISNTNTSKIFLVVDHDGINSYEYQIGVANPDLIPLEISSSIDTSNQSGFIGKLLVSPSEITTFKINKNTKDTTKYGDTVRSGKTIQGNTGFGLDQVSTPNTITIRKSGLNYFGLANTWLTANTLGPITTNPELVLNGTFQNTNNWNQINNSSLSVANSVGSIISSSFPNNYMQQSIVIEVGKVYKISFRAYYSSSNNNAQDAPILSTGIPGIKIGSTSGSGEYYNTITTAIDSLYESTFTPSTTELFISLGFGDVNSILNIYNLSIKELVPFHSFDQFEGSFYLNWDSVANSTLFQTIGASNTLISIAENVFISDTTLGLLDLGTQGANNKIAISYDANGIIVSFNGNTVQSLLGNRTQLVTSMNVANTINEFSYAYTTKNSQELVELSTI